MDSSSIKLFDENDNLVSNFDETIELVLMGVHGEKYYDTDEELQDTRMLKTINTKETEEKEVEEENTNKKQKSGKVTFKDFIPVLFFMIMTVIICVGGYIFLQHFDLSSILGF